MNMNLQKNALPKGILTGIGVTLLYAVLRLALRGGTFLDHLLSQYGILTLVCMSAAWVSIYDRRAKESGRQ